MNFFKLKTTWTNAELIVLKVCIATAYLMVGSYFDDLFDGYFYHLIGVFGVTVIWGIYLWITKMNRENQ